MRLSFDGCIFVLGIKHRYIKNSERYVFIKRKYKQQTSNVHVSTLKYVNPAGLKIKNKKCLEQN